MDREEKILEMLVNLTNTVGTLVTKVDQLDARIGKLEAKVDRLEAKVDKLEAKVDKLEAKVDRLEEKVNKLEARFDKLEARVDKLEETQQHMLVQQKENTDIIKALVHSNEVIGAKIERMEVNIARIEGNIEGLRENANLLEMVTVRNWSEIANLKKAK